MSEVFEPRPRRTVSISKRLVAVIGLVVLVIVSFFIGVHYEKQHVTTLAATTSTLSPTVSSQNNGFGGGGFRRNGAAGSVTAISPTSVTISNLRTGSDKTYSITSTTTISANGSTVSVSDIAIGDKVFIATASNGSTVATTIHVVPAFGGSGPTGSGQNTSGS